MPQRSDKAKNPKERGTMPPMETVIADVEKLLKAALQEGRPTKTPEREAVELYQGTSDPRGKTAAMLAACLSDWPSFARHLDNSGRDEGPLTMDEITALLVHRVYLRKRRTEYRDDQMHGQLRRANVRGGNGEFIAFDPEDPRNWEQSMNELREEIAYVLGGRSVRDRMVLELWLNQHTGKAIVEMIEKDLPGHRISEATVSRIVERFQDELRGRMDEE